VAEELGLFEAIYSQRALRYIKPDPIPDELIRKVLDAGIHAPNGGNSQRWNFLVIKDSETKRWIGERYARTPVPEHPQPQSRAMARSMARNDAAALHLSEHMHEVPVLILACVQHDGSSGDISRGASIYPAVQNMLLAARGLGLASVLTTRPRRGFEKETKELLASRKTWIRRPCCHWDIPPTDRIMGRPEDGPSKKLPTARSGAKGGERRGWF